MRLRLPFLGFKGMPTPSRGTKKMLNGIERHPP